MNFSWFIDSKRNGREFENQNATLSLSLDLNQNAILFFFGYVIIFAEKDSY